MSKNAENNNKNNDNYLNSNLKYLYDHLETVRITTKKF